MFEVVRGASDATFYVEGEERVTIERLTTDVAMRYTMTDPEHADVRGVRDRIHGALCWDQRDTVTLTRTEGMAALWVLDEYHRLTVAIDTTKTALRKLRELRAALRARREAADV